MYPHTRVSSFPGLYTIYIYLLYNIYIIYIYINATNENRYYLESSFIEVSKFVSFDIVK